VFLKGYFPLARKPADQSVNRDEIILAAADVLHRNGYESTTMKDIAAEVNLTAASLYHHFRNKDMLLLAVLEVGLWYVTERLEPIAASGQTAAEKLKAMIREHVVSVTKHPSVSAAMVFEIRSLIRAHSRNGSQADSEADREFVQQRDAFFTQRDHFEALFQQVVQQGIEAGEFRPVDVPIFVKTMLGAHNWVAVWYRQGGRLDGEAIAATMSETFLRALRV
jgi:TetR/AcrR family transcriptional regulator, cholesterol catabolism regulator